MFCLLRQFNLVGGGEGESPKHSFHVLYHIFNIDNQCCFCLIDCRGRKCPVENTWNGCSDTPTPHCNSKKHDLTFISVLHPTPHCNSKKHDLTFISVLHVCGECVHKLHNLFWEIIGKGFKIMGSVFAWVVLLDYLLLSPQESLMLQNITKTIADEVQTYKFALCA